MNRSSLKFTIAVLAMMAAALLAIMLDRPPAADASLPVPLPLPDSVGDGKGTVPMFCLNPDCLADVTDKLTAEGRCPLCGGEVSAVSFAERRILPADTVIARKRYTGPGGTYTVSVVVSGLEQKSIHRPQQCLPAQGFTITARGIISASRAGGPPLRMTLLRIRRDTGLGAHSAIFAYWFTDGSAETAYHLARLARMSWDRILHRRGRRWAYISVSTDVRSSTDNADSRTAQFVAALYPSLVTHRHLP